MFRLDFNFRHGVCLSSNDIHRSLGTILLAALILTSTCSTKCKQTLVKRDAAATMQASDGRSTADSIPTAEADHSVAAVFRPLILAPRCRMTPAQINPLAVTSCAATRDMSPPSPNPAITKAPDPTETRASVWIPAGC